MSNVMNVPMTVDVSSRVIIHKPKNSGDLSYSDVNGRSPAGAHSVTSHGDDLPDYDVWKLLRRFAREHKGKLGMYGFLSFSSVIGGVILPRLYGRVIDAVSSSSPETIVAENSETLTSIVALWVARISMNTAMDSLDAVFVPTLQSFMREHTLKMIIDAYQYDVVDLQTGKIISSIIKLPKIVMEIFQQCRQVFYPSMLIFFVGTFYIMSMNKKLGLMCVGGLIISLGILYFSKVCLDMSSMSDEMGNDIIEEINDLLSNMITMYASSMAGEEMDRIRRLQKEYNKIQSDTQMCGAKFKLLFHLAYLAFFTAINGFAFKLFINKEITMADLSSIFIVVLYVLGALTSASSEIKDFLVNMGSLMSVQSGLKELCEIREESLRVRGERPMVVGLANSPDVLPLRLLRLDGVQTDVTSQHHDYDLGDGLVVENYEGEDTALPFVAGRDPFTSREGSLSSLSSPPSSPSTSSPMVTFTHLTIPRINRTFHNFNAYPHEITAISGSSGLGKSTILKCMMNMVPCVTDMSFNNIPVTSEDCELIRKWVGYIPQTPILFNRSIYDNLTYGLDPRRRPSEEELSQFIDSLDLADVIPHDLSRVVGKNGSELSGGQRQLIKMINMILSTRKLFIFDEPTASLDPVSRQKVINLIKAMRSRSIILVTHDDDLKQIADRIYVYE